MHPSRLRTLLAIGAVLVVLATIAHRRTAADPQVPPHYAPLYAQIDKLVDAFAHRVDGEWDRKPYPTTFSAELLPANFQRGEDLLKPNAFSGALAYADRLRSLGFTGVTVSVGVPLLQPKYPKYREYVRFYKNVMAGLRQRGFKVMIEDGIIIPNPAITTVTGLDFKNMTVDELARDEIQVGQTVVRELKPDYVQVANEPDVGAVVTGSPHLRALNDPRVFADYAKRIATPLVGHGVAVGGGTGDWNDAAFMKALVATAPFDFFDVHFYHPEALQNALAVLDAAAKSGKPITVSECWLDKTTRAFDPNLYNGVTVDAYAHVFARSAFAFWAPLDAKYLGAMIRLSFARKLTFVSPFWSKYFFAQLPYSPQSESQPAAEILGASDVAAVQALAGGRVSSLGSFMETWLHRLEHKGNAVRLIK